MSLFSAAGRSLLAGQALLRRCSTLGAPHLTHTLLWHPPVSSTTAYAANIPCVNSPLYVCSLTLCSQQRY